MAKEWKHEEFEATDNIVGHGKENIGRSICKFLNEKGIQPEATMVFGYHQTDMHGELFLHAILFYQK